MTNTITQSELGQETTFFFTSATENHLVVHVANLDNNTINGQECAKADFVLRYVMLNNNVSTTKINYNSVVRRKFPHGMQG